MRKIIIIVLTIYSTYVLADNILLTEQEKTAHMVAMGEMMKTMYDKKRWGLSEEGNGHCIINDNRLVHRGTDIVFKDVTMRCVLFKTGTDLGKRKLFMLMPTRVVLKCEENGSTYKVNNDIAYSKCFY